MKHAAFVIVIVAILAYVGHHLWSNYGRSATRERIMRQAAADSELKEHTKEFNHPEVVKVTDGVYMAIGFAIANSILLEGPESVVIVDVTESIECGQEVLRAFRKITQKPIKALIYTHNHADHTYGAEAFVEDPHNPPEVWAHSGIHKEFRRVFSSIGGAIYLRAMRQFGVFLPDVINAGIGIRLRAGTDDATMGLVYPTKYVDEEEINVTIAGIDMKIIHIPGETDDQIGIWLQNKKVFLCADDLYRAFPNLYAIRGTPSRGLMEWVSSLDTMLALNPEHLVPSHTRPLSGAQEVKSILTSYRDAIQFVHDQTVRFINKGLTPDEIVEQVRLPEHLELHPFLREFYGTVAWSVKGVFSAYLGWFSGDPVDLTPFTRSSKAVKMVQLVGGTANLAEKAKKALADGDVQWALELSSHVLLVDNGNLEAKNIKVEALTSLGARHSSANGRNYYLTSAFEELADIKIRRSDKTRGEGVRRIPIEYIFFALQVRFKPEECGSINQTTVFHFTDSNKTLSIRIRNSVAIFTSDSSDKWDVKVITTETIWRDIIVSKMRALGAYATGEFTIEGGIIKFKHFMDCFEKD